MNRTSWILAAFLCVLSAPVLWAISQSNDKPYIPTLRWRKPKNMPAPPVANNEEDQTEEEETGVPVAVFSDILHDFDLMPPHTLGEHIFTVTNQGDGDLRIKKGTTTCKCTGIEVLDPVIPPGGEGRVKLMWKTSDSQTRFRHWGNVTTNDPQLEEEQLTIQGRVKVELGQFPGELSFDRLIRGQPATQPLLIFSQEWESFQLGDLATSWDGADWKIKPANKKTLAQVEAKSGYVVTFTTTAEFAEDRFSHWLRYEAIPGDAAIPPKSGESMIECRVLRSLSVYGSQMRAGGVIDLGQVDAGEAATSHLMLRSRSFDGELNIESIECEPKYLQVELSPFNGEGLDRTFHLDVTVPANAPPGRFRPGKFGRIEVTTNHPLDPVVDLKVELHVRKPVVFK